MPRLTLNLGVRYDGMVNFFSINRPHADKFILGSGSTLNAKSHPVLRLAGTASHVLDHNVGGFTPRIGFAWDVFGKGKTACAAASACSKTSRPTCTSRT